MAVVSSYLELLSQGRVEGHTGFNKFGGVLDVDSTTVPEAIQTQGGDIAFLPAAETCSIVSTSANDTANGTGIQAVRIQGVNGTGGQIVYKEEIVELNGLTPVTLQNQYRAIYRMVNARSGTSRFNEGVVDITSTPTALLMARMPLGTGSTFTTFFAVATGFKANIYNIYADIGRGETTTARTALITIRILDIANNAEREINDFSVTTNSPLREEFKPRITIPENHYIWIRVERVSGNDTNLRANYGFELYNV